MSTTVAPDRNPGVVADDMTIAETEQRKLKESWAKRMGHPDRPVLHKKTAVLMLYWNENDTDMLNVEGEVNRLGDVFEQDYRFNVVKKKLDTRKPAQQQAFAYLSNFVLEEDCPNGLLIVYYAGHGGSKASSRGHITFSGKFPCTESEEKYHSIEWARVEEVLSVTKSDVLEIFDCCHAGLLCAPARTITRCFDVLAACGSHHQTPWPGARSFTTAITWALKDLAQENGFYTNKLYSRILQAPNFDSNKGTELFSGRFDMNGEHLYIAAMPKPGEKISGPFREQRDEEVQQEELLDLRFHFEGSITELDLDEVAKAVKTSLRNNGVRARHVSAIGKYSIETYAGLRKHRARRVLSTWMGGRTASLHPRKVENSSKCYNASESKVSKCAAGTTRPSASISSEPLQASPVEDKAST